MKSMTTIKVNLYLKPRIFPLLQVGRLCKATISNPKNMDVMHLPEIPLQIKRKKRSLASKTKIATSLGIGTL